ncbi:MAG: hypothetical protein H8E12_10485 [Rhodobacteraceae bacterium]|nr:hypothetical protein [Paracoccaceae bacterium]
MELAHGATIDIDTGLIKLPIGSVTLNFSLEEWLVFADIIDDINTVVQVNTLENVMKCSTCDTITSYVHYEEPDESEIN